MLLCFANDFISKGFKGRYEFLEYNYSICTLRNLHKFYIFYELVQFFISLGKNMSQREFFIVKVLNYRNNYVRPFNIHFVNITVVSNIIYL